jgi:hypothetical protein
VRLVAHRGRAGGDPENAIESLPGLPGWVGGVEVDVRSTADGELVLLHDATVDRTTDGRGEINELRWEQVQRLRQVRGGSIPRLDDYLRAAAQTAVTSVMLDVKSLDVEEVARIARTVAGSPIRTRCVVLVRRPCLLERGRQLVDGVMVGALGVDQATLDGWLAAGDGQLAIAFPPPGDEAYPQHRAVIPELREAGVPAGASVINDPEVVELAAEDGCTVVITDRVLELGASVESVTSGYGGER